MFTPTKSETAAGSPRPGTPYSTPTSKGKPEDSNGFIVMVGPVEESKKGNQMINVQLQVSKTEILTLTVMQFPGNAVKEDFDQHLDKQGDAAPKLNFEMNYLTTLIATIEKKSSGRYFVKVVLEWIVTDEKPEEETK